MTTTISVPVIGTVGTAVAHQSKKLTAKSASAWTRITKHQHVALLITWATGIVMMKTITKIVISIKATVVVLKL
jgi:hypothetical protein